MSANWEAGRLSAGVLAGQPGGRDFSANRARKPAQVARRITVCRLGIFQGVHYSQEATRRGPRKTPFCGSILPETPIAFGDLRRSYVGVGVDGQGFLRLPTQGPGPENR